MTYASEVLADSPLGYWRLNETSGTVASDSSGNGYIGAYQNGPTLGGSSPISGGKSVAFDGSTQRIEISTNAVNIQSPLTVECLVKTSMSTSWGTIFGFHDGATVGWALDMAGASPGHLGFWNSVAWNYSTSVAINDNAWHHVVATYSSGTLKFYVDGVLVTTITGLAASTSLSGDVLHGIAALINHSSPPNSGFAQYNNYFAGSLAECAIYNTALSSTRIAAHFNAIGASVDLSKQDAQGYIYENVGLNSVHSEADGYVFEDIVSGIVNTKEAQSYIYENIGFDVINTKEGQVYIYENVGDSEPDTDAAQGYIYENVVPLTIKTTIGIPI